MQINKYFIKWLTVILIGLFFAYFMQGTSLSGNAARFGGLFIAVIFGLILQPVPGEQVVFLGVVTAVVLQLIPMNAALAGYGDPVVWLVLTAVLLSRGMIKTNLGPRISYILIRSLGKKPLQLGYSLVAADFVLGSMIPSNGARAGAILFPIVKSLAEAYDSKPGPTARRLGAFLMALVYQGDVIVCATFLTGQISNFLIAKFIGESVGIHLTYGQWFLAGMVPSLLALVLMPYCMFKFYAPEIKFTPLAPVLAQKELDRLGPMSRGEKITLAIFSLMGLLWMTSSFHKIHFTLVALIGISLMLMSNVLTWDDVVKEKSAWNIFIWFGGLIMLAGYLQSFGITQTAAQMTVGLVAGQSAWVSFIFLLLVYFFAHYFFASVTAHVTAMFIPFLSAALALGAPKPVAALLFAFFSNLCAALTHYGTTHGPIFFGAGYISQFKWWKIGFFVSLLTMSIWLTTGLAWWKVLGYW